MEWGVGCWPASSFSRQRAAGNVSHSLNWDTARVVQRIKADFVDAGLLQCSGGDTTRNLIFILVEVAGANVNAQVRRRCDGCRESFPGPCCSLLWGVWCVWALNRTCLATLRC